MNYIKHYIRLIRNAQLRESIDGYRERHHVFPKSMFGENSYIVELTAKEHYIAHKLLWKSCRQRYGTTHLRTKKALHAVLMMNVSSTGQRFTSKTYDYIRKEFSISITGRKRPYLRGKAYFGASEETVLKMRQKYNNTRTGMTINYPKNRKKSGPPSLEKKQKISESRKKTNEKYINMTPKQFTEWISNQSMYVRGGRINSNVTRAIMARGEDISKYYGDANDERRNTQ